MSQPSPPLDALRWADLFARALPECATVEEACDVADLAMEEYPDAALAREEAGHWITIGGREGGDGKRHGGTPVFVQNGRITKGHPSLTGKPIPFSLEPVADHDIYLAYDVKNRKAQGILNRALESLGKVSQSAVRDLERALKTSDRDQVGRSLAAFVERWRMTLASLLSPTQLAALLEGMREVVRSIPAVPLYPYARLPATLEPDRAAAMLEELRAADAAERERRIFALPPDQRDFARGGVFVGFANEPPPNAFFPVAVGDESDRTHFPTIDEAARLLASKNLMMPDQFAALDAASRQKALAIAGVESREVLGRIQTAMAETVDQGADLQAFRDRLASDDLDLLRPAHLETVFRTCVQSALSDGQMGVLRHPFVRSGFPYVRYDAIHDDRARHDHLALEKLGIGGTNIYRTDDPVIELFRPPWDYNCRCGWTPITVRQAAAAGVEEAKRWMETGVEPIDRALVAMPSFRPPPGFDRSLPAVPLSIALSLAQSIVPLGVWESPPTVTEPTYDDYVQLLEGLI